VRIQQACGHHPFIVNCPYFWQSRKQLFIVCDYVSGGEFLKLLQETGPLSEDIVRIYMAQLALAIGIVMFILMFMFCSRYRYTLSEVYQNDSRHNALDGA